MKLLKLILIALFMGGSLSTSAQVHLTEGFEGGTRPAGWTEEMASGNEPWRYRNGGHSPNDNNWQVPPEQVDITRNPPAAYEGTFNAIFFKQGDNNERTKLITPEMDLLGATALELSFYLCQIPWTFEGVTGWDILRVYYKVSAGDPWILLREYLDPVYDWQLQRLTLPNPSQNYFVAFEAQTRWGYGTCIDNITIQETGSQSLYVGDIDFEQPFDKYIPSGTTDVPIMRLGMKVFGNSDSAILEQVSFASLNSSDTDLQPDGVKLYSTSTQTFSKEKQLGTSTDFISGVASFTNLSHNLPAGISYLWLTYDVALDAEHEHILDAMVVANGIVVGDSLYPSVEQSAPGERIVYESRYWEYFEGVHNWTLTGEFEVGTPDGSGGIPGNPNPPHAFSGTRSLGTDLSGLGANPYHYEPGLSEGSGYTATSPTLNVQYYTNLNLFFRRYLNIEVWDHADIEISSDNGSTWNLIWENDNTYVSDFQWTLERILISDDLARTEQMQIRYKLGPTNGTNNYSGWNIDDLFLTGEFISKDVGVSEWIYPLSGSRHSANDSVTVRITNFGGEEIVDPVPVAYSFDGGSSWSVDQMNQSIPVGGSVIFTFPTRADLSTPGLKPFVLAKTNMPGDQYKANDQFTTQLYIIPTYLTPYLEDFETDEGYWRVSENQMWEYGTPLGSVINSASSGTSSWVTGLTQQYGDQIAEKGHIIFNDDFETEKGWTFTGEFERAVPNFGNIPYFAYSGYYCIGTDLTGLGDSPYLYENGITSGNAFTATSPAIDVTHYSNLALDFLGWIDILAGDSIKLEVSPDNGTNWYVLWQNSEGAISESDYEYRGIAIDDSLSFTDAMRFRFSLYHSSASDAVAAGWNIDDFVLLGDLVSEEPAYLSSPSYDLTGLQNPVFQARLWIDTEIEKDGANLQYSLNDGDTWITISNSTGYDTYWNWYSGKSVKSLGGNGWSGQSGGWITVRHLLPLAVHGHDDVQFRFIFKADKVNNRYDGIAVDDIQIIEAPKDIDVLEILAPASACELSADQNFTLRMKNAGIHDLEPGDSLQIGYYISHSGEIQSREETLYLTQTWNAGSSADFNLTSQFDFSKSGIYQTEVFFISDDPHFYKSISGDTVSQVIEVNKPAVDLGEDISTVRPDTVVLNASSGAPGQTYLWQDATTDPTFHVSTDGTYYVQVTNGLGCAASDTINVLQLVSDVGISSCVGPLSDCELGDQIAVEIILENFGTETVEAGDTINVHGIMNQTDYFEDMIVLTQPLNPGETIDFSYSRIFDFSTPGTYQLKLYTSMTGDVRPGNDTLTHPLEVYGYPDANLGPDTVVISSSYLLQPAPGYHEYLWQDGSTSETFTVDQSGLGLYHVRISDVNLCVSSDSVIVTLNVIDLELEELLAPSTSCELSESINISARIRNTGNVAVPSGASIQMSYQIDGGPVEPDAVMLSGQLLPGHSLDITFSKTEMLVTGTWYDFKVFVDYSNDSNSLNDTLVQSVGVFGTPSLDLGEEFQLVASTEHTLDAGPGFVSYLWQDGSTEQTYTISQSGIGQYGVTVTDVNGCTVSDQVQVLLGMPDVGMLELTSPVNHCRLEQDEEIRVAIKNYGNLAIEPSAQISVAYSINGGNAVVEDLVLQESFESGSILYHTFSREEDFSIPGRYELLAYVSFEADLLPSNNIILVNVDHIGSPIIDIGDGQDTLFIDGPVALTAATGYPSYLWQDGSTLNTYSINDPSAGIYSVVVTADNGCITHDTVFVIYDIPDIGINNIISPESSCGLGMNTEVSVELVNNGYYRISPEDKITLTYSVNDGSSVIESVQLESDFLPGESRIVAFTNTYDFSTEGDYKIQSSLIYLPDQVGTNNLLISNITHWDSPEINLGGGQDTLLTSLPVTLDAGTGFTDYLWQDNSTASSFEVTSSGQYRVRVTNAMGCISYDSVYVDSETAAGEWEALPGKVSIYPNPAKDLLYVALELDVESELVLEMFTITNSLVYREDISNAMVAETRIDVGDLTPGTYFLRITTDERPHNFLVIVE